MLDYNIATAEFKFFEKKAADSKAKADGAATSSQELVKKGGQCLETIVLTPLPPVPDAKYRFVANMNHGITRDDTLKITTLNGMLSTTNATSTDQSPAIILNLVQGVAAFSGRASPTMARTSKPDLATKACDLYSFAATFDPTNIEEIKVAIKGLYAKTKSVIVDVDGTRCKGGDFNICTVAESEDKHVESLVPSNPMGLVYRAPRATKITITPQEIGGAADDERLDASSAVFVVPDSKAAFVLPAKADAFTKSTFDFEFKDGMPTSYNITQPSELAGIASLPVDIAKAIISVPASIVKLRVDYDSQANALLAARITELNAQVDLLKAQQALEAARAKANTPAN